MHPVVGVDLLGRHAQVAAYSLFLTLAAVTVVSFGWLVAVRRGVPGKRAGACILGMALSAAVGARLLDGATKGNLYSRDPSALLQIDFSGFSMYGGFLLALPAGFLLCRLISIDPVALADALVPAIGLGIAISKLGCYLAGCSFGVPTTLPWGVVFPIGSEAHVHQLFTGAISPGRAPLPVHPVQLYEAAAALAGSVGALWLLARNARPGSAFLGFVLWFTAFRLADEQLRAPSLSLSVAPWFYPGLYTIVILIASGALLSRLSLGGERRPRARSARA